MRSIPTLIQFLVLGILLSWLSAGCDPKKGNEAKPVANCRIQHSTATSHDFASDGSIQIDYIYDAQGNLTNRTKVSQSTTSTVASDKTTTTDSYTYDAGGFLSRSVSDVHQQAQFAGKASEYHFVSTKTYSYADERLSGYQQTDVVFDSHIMSGPQQRTLVASASYTYNDSGLLTKQTNSNGESTIYQNGKAVTLISAYAFELQDGLVVKATFPGTDGSGSARTLVQVNQYDRCTTALN